MNHAETVSVDGVNDDSDKDGFMQSKTFVSQEDGYSLVPVVEIENPESVPASTQCKHPKPLDSLMGISLPDEHAYSFDTGSLKLSDCEKLCNNIPSTCKHGEFSLLAKGTFPVCVY